MKNLRKIVAILATALMLFSVMPMSAFANPGDVVIDLNFDDGGNGGFERSYNENGYIVFDATTGDWQNTYAYMSGLKTNVDYVVTFKAKANKDTSLNFKINDSWGPDAARFTVNVTTEWQEFESVINMASLTSAVVMFSSNNIASDAAIYCIDDLKIVEYKDPLEIGVVANGDFENGSEGWILNGSASIENGALKLDNCGQWSEAAMAEFAVEVGTEYTLSWKSQRISGNGAFIMFLLTMDSCNHPTRGQNWMNETTGEWVEYSIKFTAEAESLKLKLSAEVENPGVILIDDIKLTATPKVEIGKVTNGDFETGDASGWETWQNTEISTDAAHTGSYGVNIMGNGGWGGFLDQHISVEDGKTYEFSFWYKVNTSGFNWSLKGDASGVNYGSGWATTGEWTQVTKTFVAAGDTSIFLNFNGGGTGVAEDAYIDDVMIKELIDPSDDGFVKNGDFETGKDAPWTLYSGSNISADAAYTGDYGLISTNPTGGWGGTAFQDFSVEIGKSYEVTMWAKAISQGLNVQVQNGGANVTGAWVNKTEWTLLTFEFTATATNTRINICGGGTGANEMVYFDDIKVKELKDPSFDGYIYNGDFETGDVFPWDNLWGICPTVEIVEGVDGYGLHIVSGKWKHVRQTNIAVEANTIYKISLWAKNTTNMRMLVKDGADSVDLCNKAIEGGDEWTYNEYYVNTGDYTTIIVSLMGGEAEDIAQEGTFDNIVMEKAGVSCKHDVLTCQGGICSKCNAEIEGVGCTNYDTPACEDGVCYYCGGFVAGFGHENGAWAPCCDGECSYGCGLQYPATEDHVDADADDYCDNCWYHLTCIDADADGMCDICWNCMTHVDADADGWCDHCWAEMPPACEHVYDNACDADCNSCGVLRQVPDHVYADACDRDCDVCGFIRQAPHVYDNACDDTCNACAMRRKVEPHVYVATVTQDATCVADGVLTHTCSVCGDTYTEVIPATGEHVYDNACDAACNTCHTVREVGDHVYSDACDRDCNSCGITREPPHNYTGKFDEECDTCGALREVPDRVIGDLDADGFVNNLDMALLQRYLNSWGVQVDTIAADVDVDGFINNLDLAILQRYINGWDVTLG